MPLLTNSNSNVGGGYRGNNVNTIKQLKELKILIDKQHQQDELGRKTYRSELKKASLTQQKYQWKIITKM